MSLLVLTEPPGTLMLELNYPDKILAGVHQSYTFTSDEGPPSGQVSIDGVEVAHRVLTLGPPKGESTGTNKIKYKITFLIPGGAAGRTLEMKFQAAGSSIDDSKEIIES